MLESNKYEKYCDDVKIIAYLGYIGILLFIILCFIFNVDFNNYKTVTIIEYSIILFLTFSSSCYWHLKNKQ